MDSRPLIALVTCVALTACAGPEPEVRGAAAAPSVRPGATRVTMDVINRGGHGTVEIQIELRGAGQLIRAERTLELESKETVHFETDVETPPGTYAVSASAQYPD